MSLFSYTLRVHEKLYKATDGRIGHRLLGVPTLLLRTTGRRSGVTRTNGLVYAPDGADYLVVPSNGGADKPPAWLFNLEAKPEVEIQIGRERQKGVGSRLHLSTAQDIDRLAAEIKARGGTLDQEPTDMPWGQRVFMITDPDGFKLSIAQVR